MPKLRRYKKVSKNEKLCKKLRNFAKKKWETVQKNEKMSKNEKSSKKVRNFSKN